MFVGAIISFVIALGLWWVIQSFILKGEFDLVQTVVTIVTVLIAIGIAGIITKKLAKKEGIKVSVPKS